MIALPSLQSKRGGCGRVDAVPVVMEEPGRQMVLGIGKGSPALLWATACA